MRVGLSGDLGGRTDVRPSANLVLAAKALALQLQSIGIVGITAGQGVTEFEPDGKAAAEMRTLFGELSD
jgi:hypothetical protein